MTTRVLLRGKSVETPADPIEAVTAEGYQVAWVSQRASAGNLILEVTLTPPDAGREPPSKVVIRTRDGRELKLRAVGVGG